jgi:hypothetical protein
MNTADYIFNRNRLVEVLLNLAPDADAQLKVGEVVTVLEHDHKFADNRHFRIVAALSVCITNGFVNEKWPWTEIDTPVAKDPAV